MASIVLETIDSDLLAKINDLAKAQNVSIEEKIVSVLKQVFQDRENSLLAKADAIAAITPNGIKQTDSTILIREDRDR